MCCPSHSSHGYLPILEDKFHLLESCPCTHAVNLQYTTVSIVIYCHCTRINLSWNFDKQIEWPDICNGCVSVFYLAFNDFVVLGISPVNFHGVPGYFGDVIRFLQLIFFTRK